MNSNTNYQEQVKIFESELEYFSEEFDNFLLAARLTEIRMQEYFNEEEVSVASKRYVMSVFKTIKDSKKLLKGFLEKDPEDYKSLSLEELDKISAGSDENIEDLMKKRAIAEVRAAYDKIEESRGLLWDLEHNYLGALNVALMDKGPLRKYVLVQARRLEILQELHDQDTIHSILSTFPSSDPYADEADLKIVETTIEMYENALEFADEVCDMVMDVVEAKDPETADRLMEEENGIDFPLMFDMAEVDAITLVINELEKTDALDAFIDGSVDINRIGTDEIISRLEEDAGIDSKKAQKNTFQKRLVDYRFKA